jgi:bisphosphoglycerate-dependent phosphoglycerate mutase
MKQYGSNQPLMMRRDYGTDHKEVDKNKESMMYKQIPIEDYDAVPDSKTIIEIEDYDEGR